MYRHNSLTAAGGAEHDLVTICGPVSDVVLSPNRSRQHLSDPR